MGNPAIPSQKTVVTLLNPSPNGIYQLSNKFGISVIAGGPNLNLTVSKSPKFRLETYSSLAHSFQIVAIANT